MLAGSVLVTQTMAFDPAAAGFGLFTLAEAIFALPDAIAAVPDGALHIADAVNRMADAIFRMAEVTFRIGQGIPCMAAASGRVGFIASLVGCISLADNLLLAPGFNRVKKVHGMKQRFQPLLRGGRVKAVETALTALAPHARLKPGANEKRPSCNKLRCAPWPAGYTFPIHFRSSHTALSEVRFFESSIFMAAVPRSPFLSACQASLTLMATCWRTLGSR